MHIKDLQKAMFYSYVVITTGATISMYVCCLLFSPNAIFSPVDIGGILLVSLVSDLSFLVLGVYVSVIGITCYRDRRMADKLNDGLKRRYHS